MTLEGQHVDTSLALKLFVKCTESSHRRCLHHFFAMFRNTEFPGCRRVDVAYDTDYNALLFSYALGN